MPLRLQYNGFPWQLVVLHIVLRLQALVYYILSPRRKVPENDAGSVCIVLWRWWKVAFTCKLQALVYDILPSTTAVFSYAMGSRNVLANEQFCFCFFVVVGAQTVVSLLQTTQIKQGVSFIAANRVYTSTNTTTIVLMETELFFSFFFLPVVDASPVYVRALALGCFCSHISTRTFRRALIAARR